MILRVFIVEDEEMIRKGLVHTINWSDMGCLVVGSAADGRSGLSGILQKRPDVVITDIRMPKMDGITMMNLLREEGCAAHCIVLTAHSDFEYARGALLFGADDYLLKPFRDQELTHAVARVCRKMQPLPAAPAQQEKEPEVMQETGVHPVNDLSETPASNGNTGGWEDLLGTLGLSGMGDIAGNLGYVMAMLPDILLGVFTGKTQSLNIKDNLLPIASIVAGMFVRNPLLKMLLIGLGGANLLNKAGHEVLRERSEGEMNTANRGAAQYRHYPDEPLNPRITNPVLQGNMLVATIDRVPCTIQLSQTVTDAYRAGALPLNTLANAVLARSEQLRQRASDNYDNGQQETIVRTRGIQ
mgnify:CR=1 FL=1